VSVRAGGRATDSAWFVRRQTGLDRSLRLALCRRKRTQLFVQQPLRCRLTARHGTCSVSSSSSSSSRRGASSCLPPPPLVCRSPVSTLQRPRQLRFRDTHAADRQTDRQTVSQSDTLVDNSFDRVHSSLLLWHRCARATYSRATLSRPITGQFQLKVNISEATFEYWQVLVVRPALTVFIKHRPLRLRYARVFLPGQGSVIDRSQSPAHESGTVCRLHCER